MRELFRQFMFVLIQEKTKGEERKNISTSTLKSEGCSSLNSITIPPSVRTMKGNPFKEWYGHIVTNSPYFKYENGALIDVEKGLLIAFCSTATSCTIPPSVKTIGYSAFFGCENLISITIPPSITLN